MSCEDVWRWVVKGLGGAVGLLLAQHEDPKSSVCPDEWLAAVRGYRDSLDRIVREQEGKRK